MFEEFIIPGLVLIIILVLLRGIRIVRPNEKAVVERWGKYIGIKGQGITWIIPFADKMYRKNITEQLVDVEPQEIITRDNLNAMVDAQVYFKIRSTEEGIKAAFYNVYDVEFQIVNLARTTLRNEIGNMVLRDVNSKRDTINRKLQTTLKNETKNWGVDIVRTELKEIKPPEDVQDTMNKVVKAENEKIAAIDYATATETQADGQRRAAIKNAQGQRQSEILNAEGRARAIVIGADAQAQAIKKVNEAAQKYFKGNAQKLKSMEVTQASLQNNSKVIVPQGSGLINVINSASGDESPPILPVTTAPAAYMPPTMISPSEVGEIIRRFNEQKKGEPTRKINKRRD